jgi:hypothetical protein
MIKVVRKMILGEAEAGSQEIIQWSRPGDWGMGAQAKPTPRGTAVEPVTKGVRGISSLVLKYLGPALNIMSIPS